MGPGLALRAPRDDGAGTICFEPNAASPDSSLMTTLIDDRRVRARDASPARYFYLHMALACAATAFLGFAPTYFVPLAQRTLPASPSFISMVSCSSPGLSIS